MQYPILGYFENDWATEDFFRYALKAAKEAKRAKKKKVDTTSSSLLITNLVYKTKERAIALNNQV